MHLPTINVLATHSPDQIQPTLLRLLQDMMEKARVVFTQAAKADGLEDAGAD